MIHIVDNGSWGVLTKIRRFLSDWHPKLDSNGQLSYKRLKWMEKPELLFENEDTKLYVRKAKPFRDQSKEGVSHYCYAATYDEYYEKQMFCYQKINGKWQIASDKYTKEVLDAIEIMKVIAA